MKKLIKSKSGVVTFYLVFIIIAVIMVMITAVLAPFGAQISTEFYRAGESIIQSTNRTASLIQDADVRQALIDSNNQALASTADNIEVNTGLYKYSFIIILIVLGLFLFLYSRRLVEAGYGFI